MEELGTDSLKEVIEKIAEAVEENKDWLCELDGVIGDADHGVTMSVGFRAVCNSLKDLEEDATPTDLFNQSAKAFLNAMGGSAGPLYATAFMRAGAKVKGKEKLDTTSLAEVVMAMCEGIQSRGKAETGEKTMLDAWEPASEAAQKAIVEGTTSMAEMMADVAKHAQAGAEATKDLVATKGRASRLGDRTVGHMDPGAASTSLILGQFAKYLSDRESD